MIEGLAETTAGVCKLVAGSVADRMARRKPLIVAGYALSSLVRPLIALATAPWHVLSVRFFDRVGKGFRGSPRDALIADVTPPDQRGRAFGLQRAMDHLGNVAGPLIAWGWLASRASTPSGAELRQLFGFAAIPGALALATLLFLVREPARAAAATGGIADGASARRFSVRPPASPTLRRFLLAHLVFGLAGSSDAFLLVRASGLGVPLAQLPLLVVLLHVVKSALATPLGALSDRWPRRALIVAGWSWYALVYAGFAHATTTWEAWLLFGVYGLHHALVEGAERALVAELVPENERGRAFGSYHFVTAVTALPASWLFGVALGLFGAPATFTAAAGIAALGALLLAMLLRSESDLRA